MILGCAGEQVYIIIKGPFNQSMTTNNGPINTCSIIIIMSVSTGNTVVCTISFW